MKTDVITVSSSGAQMEAALAQVDKMAAFKGLTGKNALHLRLLVEEMMGMMRSLKGSNVSNNSATATFADGGGIFIQGPG